MYAFFIIGLVTIGIIGAMGLTFSIQDKNTELTWVYGVMTTVCAIGAAFVAMTY